MSVYLEAADLWCKSEDDARMAEAVIKHDRWAYPKHVRVAVRATVGEGTQFYLEVTHFDGESWLDATAQMLWLKLDPYLADSATIQLRSGSGERWRIRWNDRRVFEEHIQEVIWRVDHEITAPREE